MYVTNEIIQHDLGILAVKEETKFSTKYLNELEIHLNLV